MDKIRYVKESNGVVEEYCEVSSYQIDYANKFIQATITRVKMINGYPETKPQSCVLADIYDTSNIYTVDPSWDENSNPPKPAGFILEDPETWGGLSWEQIPKLIPNKNYFSGLFSYLNANSAVPTYLSMENFILNSLISKGDLPSASEGWVFKTVSVLKIW